MSLVNSLVQLLKNTDTSQNLAPEGVCPNCWGREEYGGKFYTTAKNKNIDFASPNPDIGWIQDYANKHLSGLKMKKKDDSLICTKCKFTFKAEG